MSAYIVNNNHMDVLVSYFVQSISQYQLWVLIDGEYGYLTKDNAYKVAETLHKQNLRSVDHRYNEENPFQYEFTYLPVASHVFSVGQIARAIDCLEYQSCETDDYYTTEAYRVLCSMRKQLLNKVADKEGADNWEIPEVEKENN